MNFFYVRVAVIMMAFSSFFIYPLFITRLDASIVFGKIPVSVYGEVSASIWKKHDADLPCLVMAEKLLLEQDDDEAFNHEHLSMLPVIKLQQDDLFAGVDEYGHSIEIWKLDTQNPIQKLVAHTREILFFTQLEDGRIVSADDRKIRIWDLELGVSVVLHELVEEKKVALFLKYSDERLGIVYQDGYLEEVLVG